MTPPGQSDGHRVVIDFDDGVSAKLICPDSGCELPRDCAICGRPVDAGNEIKRCYDCPSPTDECWIKSWFDSLTADELLHGSVEVPIRAEWDGDHMVAHIEPEVVKR
jgi:hypothetical protein